MTPRLAPALMLFLLAAPAAAQYTSPGEGLLEPLDRKQALEDAWSNARFRLGAVKIQPSFSLQDVAFVDVVDSNDPAIDSDLTATVGAGLAAYLRLGDGFLAFQALPQYTWWQDLEDRRRLTGTYGLGYFGFFSRGEAELTAQRIDELAIPNLQVLDRVPVVNDELSAKLDLTLSGAFGGFAEASEFETTFDPDEGTGPIGSLTGGLDRTTSTQTVGVRWKSSRFKIGVGVQNQETEFAPGADDRSNDGTSIAYRFDFKGNRVSAGLDIVDTELEPSSAESRFEPVSTPTGNAWVAIKTGWRVSWRVYGSQQIVYTLLGAAASSEDQRTGLGLTMEISERSSLLGFYEVGTHRYAEVAGSRREDDLTAFGATFTTEVWRGIRLRAGYTRLEIDSVIPGESKEVSTILAGLSFGTAPTRW
jgi:hypothetical protein